MIIKDDNISTYNNGYILGLLVTDLGLKLPQGPLFIRDGVAENYGMVAANIPRIKYNGNWELIKDKKWSEII